MVLVYYIDKIKLVTKPNSKNPIYQTKSTEPNLLLGNKPNLHKKSIEPNLLDQNYKKQIHKKKYYCIVHSMLKLS